MQGQHRRPGAAVLPPSSITRTRKPSPPGQGALLSFTLHDPDDAWVEVMWVRPGVRFEDAPTGPAEWKMIDLD